MLIHPEVLREIFTKGNVIDAHCVQGLPPDATFVSGFFDGEVYGAVFEHPSFEPVDVDDVIPAITVTLRAYEHRKNPWTE